MPTDACIDEELTRLYKPYKPAREAYFAKRRKPIGRKLDFLVQEMNREANTISVKKQTILTITQIAALELKEQRLKR